MDDNNLYASRRQPDDSQSQPAPDLQPDQPQKEGWKNVASTIAVLLTAPLIAVFLTFFVFQSYQVDGQSMETTLNNNDRLIVWKMPRTWARITGHAYIPHRGDIVVFNERGLLEGEKQLIKRVIGLPGDRVVVHDGILTVYNSEHPTGYQPDAVMPYGKVIGDTQPETEQTEWTVDKDKVFVCGDNRLNSRDSRSFGPIAADDIVGKLSIRVLPLNTARHF